MAYELLKGAGKAVLHAVFPFVLGKSTTQLLLTLDSEIKKAGCSDLTIDRDRDRDRKKN